MKEDLQLTRWSRISVRLNVPRSTGVFLVGAGTGRFTLVALEAGLTLTATDVNESLLEELKQKVVSRGFEGRCRIRTEDVFHLSFEDASVDFVFGIHIVPRFLTLDDQRAALQEIARILKPGGRVLFNFRNRSSLLYGRIDAKHAARDAEIEEILRSSGLRILDKRGKWLLNGRLIELVGVRIARLIARADRALWKFDPAHAWDVFVLAQKQPR